MKRRLEYFKSGRWWPWMYFVAFVAFIVDYVVHGR